MAIVMVFVTTKDEEEAEKIADVLLEKKLAACCNVVPRVKSSYWWKGKIEKNDESLLVIKTLKDLADEVMSAVKETHSYGTPTIDIVEVDKANEDCVKWVEEVTKKQ